MPRKSNLRFEKWESDGGWVDTRGTIRTVPGNYYVADVNFDNTLEFGGLESETRNINQSRVEKWWEDRGMK